MASGPLRIFEQRVDRPPHCMDNVILLGTRQGNVKWKRQRAGSPARADRMIRARVSVTFLVISRRGDRAIVYADADSGFIEDIDSRVPDRRDVDQEHMLGTDCVRLRSD